ncbi:hypothetical protein ATANTOWER_013706 [Ataeniobius toweri]|uniref:Uncharacterized protein n=1 Tax=Ataeniobius toweri TaxID=208326 RepID=A0ABU7AFF3_9TELE|nr:hypothetical protein [Ataeniobius toweri]
MRVEMCDCVCLFFVSGWVLGCSLSWISLGPPSNLGPIYPPATLPAGGWCLCPPVYLWFSVSGAGCFGVCWLTPGDCLPGLGPQGFVGPLLGSNMSQGLGSLGPWLDLLGRRQLPAGPVGSSLQLLGASALWLLGGSPGILHCSSLGGLR